MNLLQELERSVEEVRRENVAKAQERERLATLWREEMAPAMRAIEDYLRQLMERLAQVKQRPRLCYPLHGYGDINACIDRGYSLKSTPGTWQHELVLSYSAEVIPEECPVVAANHMGAVRAIAAALQQHRLGGMYNARRNDNGEVVAARFRAQGRFTLMLHVVAEAGNGLIRMNFTNLEGFGHTERSFLPRQINDELLDALGRFITRDKPRFALENLPAERLRALRERIERERLKRGRADPLVTTRKPPLQLPPWMHQRALFAPLRQLVERFGQR